MLTNTTKNYFYTGDSYGYIIVTSADGSVSQEEYDIVPTKIQMHLSVNISAELIIESLTKLQVNSYLKNVRDRAGDEIYTNGEWIILQTQPILDGEGYRAGYRYRAKLIAGDV